MEVVAVPAEMFAHRALGLFSTLGTRCLLVSSPNAREPLGVITLPDLLEALLACDLSRAPDLRVGDIQVPLAVAMAHWGQDDPLLERLARGGGAGVPHLDAEGRPVVVDELASA